VSSENQTESDQTESDQTESDQGEVDSVSHMHDGGVVNRAITGAFKDGQSTYVDHASAKDSDSGAEESARVAGSEAVDADDDRRKIEAISEEVSSLAEGSPEAADAASAVAEAEKLADDAIAASLDSDDAADQARHRSGFFHHAAPVVTADYSRSEDDVRRAGIDLSKLDELEKRVEADDAAAKGQTVSTAPAAAVPAAPQALSPEAPTAPVPDRPGPTDAAWAATEEAKFDQLEEAVEADEKVQEHIASRHDAFRPFRRTRNNEAVEQYQIDAMEDAFEKGVEADIASGAISVPPGGPLTPEEINEAERNPWPGHTMQETVARMRAAKGQTS
jgi:hypothetical protein